MRSRFRLRGAPGQGSGPAARKVEALGAPSRIKAPPPPASSPASEPAVAGHGDPWRRRPISAPGRPGPEAPPGAGAVAHPHGGSVMGLGVRAPAPRPGTIGARVYEAYLYFGAMTADECAAALGLPVLTVRPRCTELRAAGLLVGNGERRPNRSGRGAEVLVP